jgi:hypothetical protein
MLTTTEGWTKSADFGTDLLRMFPENITAKLYTNCSNITDLKVFTLRKEALPCITPDKLP